jgi:hypothetical protein
MYFLRLLTVTDDIRGGIKAEGDDFMDMNSDYRNIWWGTC